MKSRLNIFARRMRKAPTWGEKILWSKIREGKIDGYKFRRQHPKGGFILDFYCAKKKLCIEVDGGVHRARSHNDFNRTLRLKRLGISVIRFTNSEVQSQTARVLQKIAKTLAYL